jgi:ABC-2 type transport system permease protein
MLRRIWAMTQKEFIQALRDRGALRMYIMLPLIQLLIFGYGITMNVNHIRTVVADQSADSASRSFVRALVSSNYFDVVATAGSEAEVTRAMDAGDVQVGVVIPPDFAAHVARNDAQALVLVDGSDAFTSQSAYNAATAIAEAHTTQIVMGRLQASGQSLQEQASLPLDARVRVLFNPDLKDLWFLVPGMIALLLQVQTVLMTAMSVVREREGGTIEQLLVTPIRPLELMIGKAAPNIIIAFVNTLTVLAVGVSWFKVPFQGSFPLLMALCGLYVFAGLGLGLLVSSVSQNHQQVQQLNMVIMVLTLVMSGFIFPRESMPLVLQWIGNIFPLTHFIPIARGIMTKGIGFSYLRADTVALAVYVIAIMALATVTFQRRLD